MLAANSAGSLILEMASTLPEMFIKPKTPLFENISYKSMWSSLYHDLPHSDYLNRSHFYSPHAFENVTVFHRIREPLPHATLQPF